MKILILSHFDIFAGPRIFLKAPESLEEEFLERIPQLMTIYDTGFFIHIFDEFTSANLIFEIPSQYSRGSQETLLISLILTEEKSVLNIHLTRELLEDFARELKEIEGGFKSLYFDSDRFEFDPKMYEAIQQRFFDFYKSYQPTIEAIKIAELRYQSLFKGARDAIIIIDKNSEVIIDANVQVENMLERSLNEIIGLHLAEFQPKEEYKKFKDDIESLVKSEDISPIVSSIIRADGKKIPVEINASEIHIRNQYLIQCIFRDITKRVEAETKLKESEERYRHLFENSPHMLLLIDSNSIIIDANSLYLKYFKYTEEEIIGTDFRKLKNVPQETTIFFVELFNNVLTKGYIEPVEFQLFSKKDRFTWVSLQASLIEIEGKKMIYVIMRDINERKNAEKNLRESEEKYRGILENMNEGYYEVDLRGNFTFFNEQTSNFLGYSKYELLGKNFREMINKNDIDDVYKKFNSVYKSEIPNIIYESEVITGEGKKKIIENSVNLRKDSKGKRLGFYCLARDITERKKSELKIKESEEKFRTLAEQSIMGIGIFQEGSLKYINKAFSEITEFSLDEISNWPKNEFRKIIHPDDLEYFIKHHDEQNLSYRVITKSGKVKWIERFSKSIFYQGEFAEFITLTDITEKREYAQKLQDSELKYRLITENVNEMISVINENFENEYRNENMHIKITGYSNEERIGKSPLELIHPDDRALSIKMLREGFKSGEGKGEIRHKRKDGQWIWLDVKGKMFIDIDGKKKALVISRDITERKKAEEKLKDSEQKYREAFNRANFYRELFAHDFNNIIQNIHSSAELFQIYDSHPEKEADVRDLFKIISEQVKRARKLITNVQALTNLEETEISIGKKEAFQILNESIRYINETFQDRNVNIQIDFQLFEGDSIIKLKVNANEFLNDVFDNILINSIKYNENKLVEIIINISKEEKNNKKYIKLEFRDNGIGIPDERKEKVFQRGYHKERSIKGMGLGLSLVKKIIESYNGEIWVEDKVKGDYKKGSNFVLLIPEAE